MRVDGFTHLELLLALAFMATLIAAAHQALRHSLHRSTQLSDARAAEVHSALAVIARDVRCAYLVDTDPTATFVVRPEAGFGRLDFVQASASGAAPSFTAVGFEVKPDGDGRFDLFRRGSDRATFLCGDVATFDVEVFDGEKWQPQWGWNAVSRAPTLGIRGLPLLVSIRLAAGTGDRRREARKIIPVFTALLGRAAHG